MPSLGTGRADETEVNQLDLLIRDQELAGQDWENKKWLKGSLHVHSNHHHVSNSELRKLILFNEIRNLQVLRHWFPLDQLGAVLIRFYQNVSTNSFVPIALTIPHCLEHMLIVCGRAEDSNTEQY